jgi:hypothetical protein
MEIDEGPNHPLVARLAMTEPYAAAAERNSAAKVPQAVAATSIGDDPGPA